jgi:pimeloyl-ACP methyl ester carboxylesterase
LHYDLSGTGRTVIVLAGGAARHPSYLGDLAGIPGQRATPHLRGVGDSPAPATPEAGSYWNQAADIETLRKHLGLPTLTLIAHSAGTRLAIAYAAQYPDRVNRMLLITPPAGYLVTVPSDADEISAHRRGEPAFDTAVAALSTMPQPGASDDEFATWQETTAPAGYAAWTEKEQAHAKTGRWYPAAVFAYFSVTPPHDLPDRLSVTARPGPRHRRRTGPPDRPGPGAGHDQTLPQGRGSRAGRVRPLPVGGTAHGVQAGS